MNTTDVTSFGGRAVVTSEFLPILPQTFFRQLELEWVDAAVVSTQSGNSCNQCHNGDGFV